MAIVCCGEVMVEFAATGELWQQGFGGDTFNTAIYLARAGHSVQYLTALGDDGFSDQICQMLEREQVQTNLLRRCSGARPGLYTIHTRADGERSFCYWRDHSPARSLFEQPVQLPQMPEVFYFSGITLAVMRTGIEHLLGLLEQLHSGGCRIMYDPNYRPVLWQNAEQAQQCNAAVLPYCHTVLPTLADEQQLWGVATVAQCADFYRAYGVAETVIKAPDLSCHVVTADACITQATVPVVARDTTGAGDAFNAAYLAARLHGVDIIDAIAAGQRLAAQVVQQVGAIIPAI